MSKPDYATLLDAEMRAYIARCDSFYPPDAVDLTIVEQRAVYDRMCAAFHAGRPDSVTVTDEPHGGVPCRCYEAGATEVTVVYFHGGGFVVGGLHSHDDICAEICRQTGYRVVSVDYGLAPEVRFPGCFNDAWAATQAITTRFPGRVVLAGDSAGGNLAAAVSHHARGTRTAIAGQVLIYPSLGGDKSQGSYVTHAEAPQLSTRDMAFYQTIRTGGAEVPKDDPRFAPLCDNDFSGLPATVVITAECDPLSSDGEAYRNALENAGGQVVWIEEAGLVHGYLRARTMSSKARASFDRIVAAIAALGAGQWPVPFS